MAFYLVIHNSSGLPEGNIQSNLLRGQIFNFLSLMGLYAVQFLDDRYGGAGSGRHASGRDLVLARCNAIVTKPVRRMDVVLGKWLGYALLLALYLILMIGRHDHHCVCHRRLHAAECGVRTRC